MSKKRLSGTGVEKAIAQVAMAKLHGETRLSKEAVMLLTGWSAPTLYRRCSLGNFPRTVAPGKWEGRAVLEYLAKH